MIEIENKNDLIIKNAIEWANFRKCNQLTVVDMVIVAEHFNVKLPSTFKHFISSKNPNHAKISGAEKSVMCTLEKIRDRIIKTTNGIVRGRKKGDTVSNDAKMSYKIASKRRAQELGACGGQEIRPVVQLSAKDGRFIARYDNAKEGLKELGKPLNRNDIGACCRAFRNKKTSFGFIWMFEDDYLRAKEMFDEPSVETLLSMRGSED